MVSKITIFEAHFDGARFGQTVLGSGGSTVEDASDTLEETDHSEDRTDDQAESKSRLVTPLQGATVFVAMFAILYRVLSRGETQAE